MVVAWIDPHQAALDLGAVDINVSASWCGVPGAPEISYPMVASTASVAIRGLALIYRNFRYDASPAPKQVA